MDINDEDMIIDDEGAPDNPPAEVPENQGVLLDNDEPDKQPDEPSPEPEPDAGEDPTPAAEDQGDPEAEPAAPAEPAPKLEIQPEPVSDPGTEFAPKGDYAFDIELADGTKLHVTKPEDIENLPADADFGTPANLMKAQAKLNVMTSGLEAERREWEASKQQYETQKAADADLEQRVTTMEAEINYLEGKGKLPPVEAKYADADWSHPDIAKQPGVKERLDLLNYRAQENELRSKLKLPPMSLLEAHLQMQNDQATAKAAEEKTQQGEQRKAKGAMVGGSAPTPATNIPDDMIVGDGGNIRDLNPAY